MPVDLTLLPKPKPEVKKINRWFWVILLVGFILCGSIITFVLSFFYNIPNNLFISGFFLFPFFAWLLIFLNGIYFHGYRKNYNKEWNLHRERRKQQLIKYGQRGLYVLEHALVTQQGNTENVRALKNKSFQMIAKQYGNDGAVIAYTSLINDYKNNDSNYNFLKSVFEQWKAKFKVKFLTLNSNINIHVRLFFESELEENKMEVLWSETLGKIINDPASFKIEEPKNSSTFIESWLDNSQHDNELLLVISSHMFQTPVKNEGEFISMLLLAGENVDKNCYASDISKSGVKVHRSEQTNVLNNTIDNALLWSSDIAAPYDIVWCNCMTTDIKNDIMNYFNEIRFEPKDVLDVENSIGNAGLCSYWLNLALAIENIVQSKNKQLVILGSPYVTASVVSCLPEENNKRSEKNEKL
ncbi:MULTISPECIES: hypothetical protein [unclassified Gilliamella]|uniref:hypothetical protein n=1 Tax=unclassified Gilliamella TaxID=2685620 RepID=UPI0022698F00|nr:MULTISPECIES: hypothetical protein [unclassified Gilliamella]MCX8574731.1 hypothetical protein [Gilliamella sp. B3831]MCX8576915.1 hypothetical protein [Gilliamella sp. B3815]MCX8590455.1 hypothetical protein [Gilliamella sp. B3812]MCX8604063.1 hypothetical protein [Gilliamella sp. B3823]MCX8605794.1 hypothetical protein [Gilliamella sp. B3825]